MRRESGGAPEAHRRRDSSRQTPRDGPAPGTRAAPAGADGVTLGILFVVLFLFWRFVLSDQAKAESAARDKAGKK